MTFIFELNFIYLFSTNLFKYYRIEKKYKKIMEMLSWLNDGQLCSVLSVDEKYTHLRKKETRNIQRTRSFDLAGRMERRKSMQLLFTGNPAPETANSGFATPQPTGEMAAAVTIASEAERQLQQQLMLQQESLPPELQPQEDLQQQAAELSEYLRTPSRQQIGAGTVPRTPLVHPVDSRSLLQLPPPSPTITHTTSPILTDKLRMTQGIASSSISEESTVSSPSTSPSRYHIDLSKLQSSSEQLTSSENSEESVTPKKRSHSQPSLTRSRTPSREKRLKERFIVCIQNFTKQNPERTKNNLSVE